MIKKQPGTQSTLQMQQDARRKPSASTILLADGQKNKQESFSQLQI